MSTRVPLCPEYCYSVRNWRYCFNGTRPASFTLYCNECTVMSLHVLTRNRMPLDNVSRNTAELTLAAAIGLIAVDPRLDAREKSDFRSALRSLCRVFGKDPAELVADPRALRRRMKEFGPAVAGLSPGRWRNICSLSMSALKSVGVN